MAFLSELRKDGAGERGILHIVLSRDEPPPAGVIREEVVTALGSGLGSSPDRERQNLNTRDWSPGPWQGYASMPPDTIAQESAGNITFLFAETGAASFINAKGSNIYDSVDILAQVKNSSLRSISHRVRRHSTFSAGSSATGQKT